MCDFTKNYYIYMSCVDPGLHFCSTSTDGSRQHSCPAVITQGTSNESALSLIWQILDTQVVKHPPLGTFPAAAWQPLDYWRLDAIPGFMNPSWCVESIR
ncbi:hypothetical protein V2A60_005166 [Cordyceps javanica]